MGNRTLALSSPAAVSLSIPKDFEDTATDAEYAESEELLNQIIGSGESIKENLEIIARSLRKYIRTPRLMWCQGWDDDAMMLRDPKIIKALSFLDGYLSVESPDGLQRLKRLIRIDEQIERLDPTKHVFQVEHLSKVVQTQFAAKLEETLADPLIDDEKRRERVGTLLEQVDQYRMGREAKKPKDEEEDADEEGEEGEEEEEPEYLPKIVGDEIHVGKIPIARRATTNEALWSRAVSQLHHLPGHWDQQGNRVVYVDELQRVTTVMTLLPDAQTAEGPLEWFRKRLHIFRPKPRGR